ncbi:hypothetical protein GTP44_04005 [Duganella sp. FT50W]|uniref:Uncharacterized protein n=1 Tax=Duganella lactea TaxID=2692173 RepID=A0A6L8MGY9_9BURK|nr:hypothetical protein [Duganella lactea]MYM81122.1 hypothetical protein [Duganella lactea]
MMTTESLTATAPGPIRLEVIDRASVRALVESEGQYLAAVAKAGENVHQVALDRQDEIAKFAAALPAEDIGNFYALYNEEVAAAARASSDRILSQNAAETAKLMQRAQDSSNLSTWVSIMVFFIILITAIGMFK